jgi:hypothetical protein
MQSLVIIFFLEGILIFMLFFLLRIRKKRVLREDEIKKGQSIVIQGHRLNSGFTDNETSLTKKSIANLYDNTDSDSDSDSENE